MSAHGAIAVTASAYLVVCGVAPADGTLAAAPAGPGVGAPSATQEPLSGYLGAETCLICHEGIGTSYYDSKHARAFDPRTPAAAEDCETCHGPGEGHILDPGDATGIKKFNTMAPRDVAETCRTCHNRQEYAMWESGPHASRNVTCTNCHSIHQPNSETRQLVETTVTETCAQCHRDKAMKIQRVSHMPVLEGKLECSTCHNPHGSTNERLLRTGNTVNEFCVSCHAEKRGPFLWEHPPVVESCTTCHDPHGASNDRLLVAKPPMLCQRCHVHSRHPATIYDATQAENRQIQIIGRGCVNCHSNIHGSNHPSGWVFQR
jgi:DmsE family decaheme c-type cytochrome